ncbi:MAG: Fe-S-containing protein, partial [Syntrophorhabdaceae bacterium]
DGVIRAAFDTCVVCWREGKGYKQKDDTMVCNNCGKRFKTTKINEVTGGCNPAPLARKTENGQILIKVENLLEGKQLFARGGK